MERNQTAYTGFDPNHYQIELSVRGGMHHDKPDNQYGWHDRCRHVKLGDVAQYLARAQCRFRYEEMECHLTKK